VLRFQGECVIRRLGIVAGDVICDHLLSHLPYRGRKVPTCPAMLTPIAFSQMGKFLLQDTRCATFDLLHEITRRVLGRRSHQDVNVIFTHMSTDNGYLMMGANLPHSFAHTKRDIPNEHLIPVFCHPDKMTAHGGDGMRACSILHSILLVLQCVYPLFTTPPEHTWKRGLSIEQFA